MSITLIRTNSDGVVHGADNDKLTGCRKRLQTMSSTREGEMKDIVDLTCERCKEYFAKKMIRESNREESKMAKEEKKRYQRAKKQGIVSESTYEEYVMNRESEASARRDSKKDTNDYPPLKADLPDNNYPSYQNYNQPTAQPAAPQNPVNQYAAPPAYQPQAPFQENNMQQPDNGPAPQYMQYQPSYEQYKSTSDASNQGASPNPNAKPSGSNDDFLAQFMINKPAAEPEQPESQVNSAVVYNDPLAAAKSSASSILSQLESDFGLPQNAGRADASSFYNSNSPLVDPASASTFESVTNEFGTFKAPEQPAPVVNDFSVPEVPQLNKPSNPVNSFEDLTLSAGNSNSYMNYVNSFDSASNSSESGAMSSSYEQNSQSLNSIDTIVPPVLDDMDSAIAAAERSLGNAFGSSVQPTLDAFAPVTPPAQPTLDAFAPVTPPAQPALDAFAPVTPPAQPTLDAFAPVTPPAQPTLDAFAPVTPPVQPALDAFAPVTPPAQPTLDAFAPVTPPVQGAMNGFSQVIPPVQPAMNGFAPVTPPPVQPVFNQYAPVQPSSQPVAPYAAAQAPVMNNSYSAPVQPAAPVQNTSQFVMPQMAPKAAYQAKAPQAAPVNNNPVPVLFNQAHSPMADSIEDALIALGAETVKKVDTNQASDKEEIMPNFVAYVPSSSKVLHSAPPVNDYSSAPKRSMSAREAKRAAKIDAKFRKELIERGYSPDEIKSQRRGK